jgi:protein-tyrosine-phosphatase
MTMNILFVCYGNACRSPMAEGLAKWILGEKIRVESAGLAPVLHGATREAIDVLNEEYGIDISHHKARDVVDITMDLFQNIIVLDAYVFQILKGRFPSVSDRFILWDIADPYGLGKRAFKKTAGTIKKSVERNLVPLLQK